MTRSSWTKPMCLRCWTALRRGVPVRIVDPDIERCCQCGSYTDDGIHVRADPDVDCQWPQVRTSHRGWRFRDSDRS